MIEILNASELLRAKDSGALVGRILQTCQSRATVGTNLLEIDAWAQQMIADAGGVSPYVDYAPSFGRGPFGHYICTSVNDAVLHGLPRDYVLADGDLLSLDLAVSLDGIVTDSALSFVVGGTSTPESLALIEATERALDAGDRRRRTGRTHRRHRARDRVGPRRRRLPDQHAVRRARRRGRPCTRTRTSPTPVSPVAATPLRLGLLLALEPWVMTDTDQLMMDPDGWTLRSATGCLTAHSEHTIAITDDGAEILTLPPLRGSRAAAASAEEQRQRQRRPRPLGVAQAP